MPRRGNFGTENHQQLLQAAETVSFEFPDQPGHVRCELQTEQARSGYAGIVT